ncbi:hypothetical protein [Rhizobium sp. GN54]|uniref:hypothetical protein n=1 Tax=Rhizobium sp. GN54 TaxID=2898150 RepID=UPI001E598FD5|nr:hypothetical protein [Rhizobium sp. GN54]MCD2181603.1 hypothetical protein [Rhizobium sp. GN54]
MSSDPSFTVISPAEMKMIKSILDSAGYDASLLRDDQRQFNAAALLLMKLFLAGETSPDALSAQLEYNFGKASVNKLPYKSPFARYAIQGLPSNLRELRPVVSKASSRSIQADEQSWENEGGAVGHPRASFSMAVRNVLTPKGDRLCLTEH